MPKRTFGSEIKELNASQMNQFNVALNTAIRRIFGFRQWQSIRQIREVYSFASHLGRRVSFFLVPYQNKPELQTTLPHCSEIFT